ncbi:hypothetical protein FUT82_08055 [Treponema phagedenis]|uniref:Uncharacterized protein n=4 Tax=Treponema phagedenis TaxID=162 RepID=A0AAE6ITI0_TREPH|nr:hypothetical protein FUT82_08055 [Treponema phagedenis]
MSKKKRKNKRLKQKRKTKNRRVISILPIGEMSKLLAEPAVCEGEMLSEAAANLLRTSIPLNPLATEERIQELKHELEPMDCIFAVKYRTSRSGKEYADSAYEEIVNTILTADVFVPACYGHQSQAAVVYEGRPLMGSVIGALLDKATGTVYYRIIPDKGEKAADMRRWLKNKQINAISIWGYPTYESSESNTVVGYRLLSVDFVPPGTQGQENVGLAIGQMADMSYSELRQKISAELEKKYTDYVYVEDVYNEYIIAEHENQFYKIPYQENQGNILLGTAKKVRRVTTYEPVEVEMENITNDALLAELKKRTNEGRLSAEKAAGEMGLKLEDAEKVRTLEAAKTEFEALQKAAGEMGLKLDEVLNTAKAAKEKEQTEAKLKAHGEMVESLKVEKGLVKDGKPTGEMAAMVDKFAHITIGMTREQIAGEMDRVINDADIQKLVQGKSAQPAIGEMGGQAATSGDDEIIRF